MHILCFMKMSILFAWKAARRKICGKKTPKNVFFLKNLYFFEGWSRENRRQKKLKKYKFYFLKLIFFGGLVAGKSAAKKLKKI